MDLHYFFKVLLRRKWLLLLVALTAAAAAFVYVTFQPRTYVSNAILSTGIIVEKGIDLDKGNAFVQKFQIENSFSNLVESLQSRSTIRTLGYQLLLHDRAGKPFHERLPDAEITYSQEEIDNFLQNIETRRDSLHRITFGQREDGIFNQLAKAYQYDYESIRKKLDIRRIGETDYLNVTFESDDPELCEFVVNTLCESFIEYNSYFQNKEENEAVTFYQELVREKKSRLDSLNQQLTRYQQNNSIINLEEQSKTVVAQIKELEVAREEEQKKIEGHESNIDRLDGYLSKENVGNAGKYANDIFLSEDVIAMREELQRMNDQYVASGRNNNALEKQLEKKREQMDKLTEDMVAKSTKGAPRSNKNKADDLLEKRINEELDLSLAEGSVRSIDREIGRLRSRAQSMVSNGAFLENLTGEKEIATEEYLNAVKELDKAKVISLSSVPPLSFYEYAQIPEKPESSNRIILAAFAGIAALSLATVILFLLTLMDNSLLSPAHFSKFAKLPLIGTVNQIKKKEIDLSELFKVPLKAPDLVLFRESLRKLRFAIETSNGRIFLFTSPKAQEGKTFLIVALAHALSRNGKRILIVDTNFRNNTLTTMANKRLLNNPLYTGSETAVQQQATGLATHFILNGNVDIIGNRGAVYSPSELLAGNEFGAMLEDFKEQYDYVFMESAALNDFSDTRELAQYADKIIAVFAAQSELGAHDREAMDYLHQLNGNFMGAVLNKVDPKNFN